MCGTQELVKLRVMRLGAGVAEGPPAPEDGEQWSTVGRKGAKTTTRGDECLAVRLNYLVVTCRVAPGRLAESSVQRQARLRRPCI